MVRVERNLRKEKEKVINGLPGNGASRHGVNPRAAAKPVARKIPKRAKERMEIGSPASSERSAWTCLREGSASSGMTGRI